MTTTIREETLRIAGERVGGTQTIEVHNPYTNEVVGSVPTTMVRCSSRRRPG